MTIYVIKRMDQGGGCLAPPGSEKTWIKDKAKARRFDTYESALSECCENEEPVKL